MEDGPGGVWRICGREGQVESLPGCVYVCMWVLGCRSESVQNVKMKMKCVCLLVALLRLKVEKVVVRCA